MVDKINFEINDDGVQKKIDAVLKAAQGVGMYNTIGSAIANKVRLCFKFGIDPWGTPWAALKWRKGNPLRHRNRTHLRQIIVRADNSGVTIGSAAQGKIGRTHQFGAVIKPKNPNGFLIFPGPGGKGIVFSKGVTIPQRAFLPQKHFRGPVVLPPTWSTAVVRSLRTYFAKVLK